MADKKTNAALPASSAGLLRFFEDETKGIKVNPKIVIKISEIKAPNGPPRFSTTPSEFLLKKPESASVYETKLIKTYRENAIRKKLRKLTKVFCKYGFDMRFIIYCKLKPLLNHNFFNIEL